MFTTKDEHEFSAALIRDVPGIRFIDNNVWDSSPRIMPFIDACQSPFVYLWDSNVVHYLPTVPRPDGRVQGPASGVVIQFERSRSEGDTLLSGGIAAGYDRADDAVVAFVNSVWLVLRRMKLVRLYDPNQMIDGARENQPSMFAAGPDAASRSRAGALRLGVRSTRTLLVCGRA